MITPIEIHWLEKKYAILGVSGVVEKFTKEH